MSFFSDITSAVGLDFSTDLISDIVEGDQSGFVGDVLGDWVGSTTDLLGDSGVLGSVLNDGTNTPGTVDRIPQVHVSSSRVGATGTDLYGGHFMRAGLPHGVIALGAYLARRFGTAGLASARAIINRKAFSMGALRGYVEKYGAAAVATALGIGIDQLARLLLEAPKTKRRRRRGITYRQLSSARRVCRTIRSMEHYLGSPGGCAPFHRRSSSRRRSSGSSSTIIAQR